VQNVAENEAKNEAKTEGNQKNKFNWIAQRAECTLPRIFKHLMEQTEGDVKTRNDLRPPNSPYEFSLTESGQTFAVHLTTAELRRSVTFALAEHAIVITDPTGTSQFEVTLTFSDEGKCQLHAKGQPREYWEVRRLALEDLMFHAN
jgi:hypothetical protein